MAEASELLIKPSELVAEPTELVVEVVGHDAKEPVVNE